MTAQQRLGKNAILTMRNAVHPNKAEELVTNEILRQEVLRLEEERKGHEKSLHESVRGVLIVGQVLGLLPVVEIFSANPNSLSFAWKSWKTLYCLVSCIGTGFIMLMLIWRMAKMGTDLFIISTFVFHFCKIGITLSFLYLARRWPNLMVEWWLVEKHMKSYGWIHKFENRVRIIATIILTIAAVQYIVNQISNAYIASECSAEDEDVVEYFYRILTFPYVFSVINYSIWMALLLQVLDLLASFTWCYVDLFIMILSAGLVLRFKQVTDRLKTIADSKCSNENTWRTIREDYNRLSNLCKSLDDCLSYLVLMSFGSNLYFILIQLFNSLREMKKNVDKLYFFLSFGFLIVRTVYVSLYAAWVNDESKMPIAILNCVPSSVYNLEIRRFIHQISFDTVALTGRNFFSVTRGLILSVAGAIVTYELVLIQFNENLLRHEENSTTFCTERI